MQEWKASEKEAQKMTRDGAISVNLVTGEATHISDRPQEQDYSSADETAGTLSRAVDEVEGHVERRQAKKARRKRRDTFREGEAARDRPSSRLQFSEADRAAPELKKAVRKSDKAADKLDAAKAAVPVKPPGKEHGNPLSRPVQEVKSTLHSEVSKVEGENSGVQAGHLGERQIEKAVGYGGRRIHQARTDRKLKPWRDVKQAEQAAVKSNADFYWRKSVMENPQLASSNPISRLWQKKRLQKQYAAAHRAGTGAAQAAGKASQTAASAAKKGGGTIAQKLGGFVTKNKHTLLIVGGIGLILMLIMGLMQSCTSMFGGGTSGLVASSYLSEDCLKKMWERLRPGLGETIYGAVRTPAQWRLLVSEEEFQKGNFPRLGLFDDGIFASKSHLGTFGTMTREAAGWKAPWIREEELSFLETLGKRLPIGGEAVSPESITQEVPSKTALATSETSARVGRGLRIMESSICVAVMTGLPQATHWAIMFF